MEIEPDEKESPSLKRIMNTVSDWSSRVLPISPFLIR